MRTPLFDKHIQSGARMVDFNGWEMPLYYSGIIDEHKAVRGNAGLFDLCHMARLRVSGEEAEKRLSENTTGDIFSIKPGTARYMLVCSASGGIIDDILVYRGSDYFLVAANAGNRETVLRVLGGRGVYDMTFETGMLAVQGPESPGVADKVLGGGIPALANYGFAEFVFEGSKVTASRTGYTGEDGFELFFGSGLSGRLWDCFLSAGAGRGIQPAGLGARDILRLEAGMPLYGHELSLSVNPFEAGLGRFVSFKKAFTGRPALEKYRTEKPGRMLKGIITPEKAVPRQGCPVYSGEIKAGEVTSGSYSPSLEKSIGMAYIKKEFSAAGTGLEVEVRKRRIGVKVVDLPFYRKGRKHGIA